MLIIDKLKYDTNATGVTYEKKRNKYKAQIMIDGKQIFLGRYKTWDEVREARLKANDKYIGVINERL